MHKITIDFDEISVTDNFAIEIFILWQGPAGSRVAVQPSAGADRRSFEAACASSTIISSSF